MPQQIHALHSSRYCVRKYYICLHPCAPNGVATVSSCHEQVHRNEVRDSVISKRAVDVKLENRLIVEGFFR
jgi:hypothetical protein